MTFQDNASIRFTGPVMQALHETPVENPRQLTRSLPAGIEDDARMQFHMRVTREELAAWKLAGGR